VTKVNCHLKNTKLNSKSVLWSALRGTFDFSKNHTQPYITQAFAYQSC